MSINIFDTHSVLEYTNITRGKDGDPNLCTLSVRYIQISKRPVVRGIAAGG